MNFKKLLIHWSKLLGTLMLLVMAHTVLYKNADFVARSTLPAMTNSQAEVEEKLQDIVASIQNAELSDLSTSDKQNCYIKSLSIDDDHQALRNHYCLNDKLRELKSQRPNIADAQEELMNLYDYKVVGPRIKMIEDYALPWGFGIMYSVLTLIALSALWQWLKSSIFPALRNIRESQLLGRINLSKVSKFAQDWLGDRAYRKAAEEFMHLDTLHKNGLISDELFHLQKAELSVRLNARIKKNTD